MVTIHAPDLPADAVWLNVGRPLTRADLRGRVVVLDFFTYACINCLHTLPVLTAAERELAGEPVAFVGVHSPKFPTEGDPALVREALRRHGVTHPVVVDTAHRVWSEYGVNAWPTLVLIRPDGTIFLERSGEPEREPLVAAVRAALAEQPDRLVAGPLPLRPDPPPPGVLAYPGGIATGPDGFWVADTDHHQVVDCASDGTERRRFGSGAPGLRDGGADDARLLHPHGLAPAPEGALVVADTGNHAVRRIDLGSGAVTTLAGTGRRARALGGSGLALRTDLRSPWDVAVHPLGAPLIAMAGSHQLWAVDQVSRRCSPAPAARRASTGRTPPPPLLPSRRAWPGGRTAGSMSRTARSPRSAGWGRAANRVSAQRYTASASSTAAGQRCSGPRR